MIFYLESELRSPIERCLREAREKLLESVKLRALEDKWRPSNFANKNGILRLSEDLNEIGISSIQPWIYGTPQLIILFTKRLASNVFQFRHLFHRRVHGGTD